MTSRAKAPLRLGLAGGGTDVSPYRNLYGGQVVNATVGLYARAAISQFPGNTVHLHHGTDQLVIDNALIESVLPPPFDLYLGVIKFLRQEYNWAARGVEIRGDVDVPLGSGLGTSSTLVVALLGACLEHLGIMLSKQEIANASYTVEREILGHAGGMQDQYAAVFGGFNFMEFRPDGSVRVEGITMDDHFRKLLQERMLLYYTKHDRRSSLIISEQADHVRNEDIGPLRAMHQLKDHAELMHRALLEEDLAAISALLEQGHRSKKQMAAGITNARLENILTTAREAGATSGKISGAGGGGFMTFFVVPDFRIAVRTALHTFGGQEYPFEFVRHGLTTWKE